MNIKQALSDLHELIMNKQPRTIDELLEITADTDISKFYGFSVVLVHYMGCFQGVKIQVTGRKNHHYLPSQKENVYCCGYDDFQKYVKSGWEMKLLTELE